MSCCHPRLTPSKYELVAFTSNLVALMPDLVDFGVDLVAFTDRLVALSHLMASK